MKKTLLIIALLMLPTLAMAKPDGATAKQVADYYLTGSDVLLLETSYCANVVNEKCVNKLDSTKISKDTGAFIWMSFMVPKPVKSNLFFQFNYKGRTHTTSEVAVKDTLVYKIWIPLPTDKSGDWKIVVEQEKSQGYEGVTNLAYTIK